ncbi:MAG: membrane protein insertion efficiency factor YidD, partial [Bacteroidales bacterium]|nr:membrane protein insertion efficiency factor YidD [Bacteroidales bacterium]
MTFWHCFSYFYIMISIKKIGTYILSSFVHFYRRAISPYLHPSCRHYPSCSQYMLDALER